MGGNKYRITGKVVGIDRVENEFNRIVEGQDSGCAGLKVRRILIDYYKNLNTDLKEIKIIKTKKLRKR